MIDIVRWTATDLDGTVTHGVFGPAPERDALCGTCGAYWDCGCPFPRNDKLNRAMRIVGRSMGIPDEAIPWR